jgi:hypothetical protein
MKGKTRVEDRTDTTGRTHAPLSGQPPWWLIVLTAALALADRLVLLTHEPKLVVAANTWEPLVLGVALGFVALRLFVGRPSSAWTAYAWSLLSLMAFFCVGPLIYTWGGPGAVKYALSFLPLNERDLLQTNLLTALGMLSYFLGVRLVSFWQGPRLGEGTFRFTTRPRLLALAVTFLVIGAVLNIAVMYPYDLQLSNRIYPGVLINLGDTYLLGGPSEGSLRATLRRSQGGSCPSSLRQASMSRATRPMPLALGAKDSAARRTGIFRVRLAGTCNRGKTYPLAMTEADRRADGRRAEGGRDRQL